MCFVAVCMLVAALCLVENGLTVFVFVYMCVMVLKRAVSDSIRNCAAQSWDYLSQGRVSAAVLPALWHNSRVS